MAVTTGTVELPVRLVIGESDPIDMGTVEVQGRLVDGRFVIDMGAMDNDLAAALERAAAQLREKGDEHAASGNG